MKKRIAILLTLVMMLSMSLTACANTPTTNDVVDDSLLILLQINNPNTAGDFYALWGCKGRTIT